MDDLISRLADVMSLRQVKVTGGGGAARALIAQQRQLYQTYLSIFQNVPWDGPNGSGSVGMSSLCLELLSFCTNLMESNPPSISETGGDLWVTSLIPILDDAAIQSLREFVTAVPKRSRPSSEAGDWPYIAAAAVFVESPGVGFFQQVASTSEHEKASLFLAASRYAAGKAFKSNLAPIKVDVEQEVAKARGTIENLRGEFEVERETLRLSLDTISASSGELQTRIEAADSALLQTHERLANFEATIREEMKLDRARLTWESRYVEARRAFIISICLLATFLVITIAAAVLFGMPMIVALTKAEMESGGVATNSVAVALTHQFGRLIVFSVPVFVYLWVLRAVMRYFMRSMLLMDDARQRQTMLDTYFLLSEKGRADERDRPLVLWALFRQTPGHGSDGVEPPDFTEVINAGMKRAGEG